MKGLGAAARHSVDLIVIKLQARKLPCASWYGCVSNMDRHIGHGSGKRESEPLG